jgi:BlaI family transcriptional regulator, penicillinase repressor
MASPRISAAEWEVMNVLWARSPLSSPEVFQHLPAGHGWNPKTVNTFLARLVKKRALKISRGTELNTFTPLIKRQACVADEGASFLQRVFKGAAGPLVMHFCEHAELTDAEIAELEALLKTKKKR